MGSKQHYAVFSGGRMSRSNWLVVDAGPRSVDFCFPSVDVEGRGLSSRQLGMRTCRRTALIMDNNACDTKAERCLMNKCGCMNERIQIGANDSHLGTRAVNNPRQRPRKIGRWLDSPATCLSLALLDAGTISALQVGGGGGGGGWQRAAMMMTTIKSAVLEQCVCVLV